MVVDAIVGDKLGASGPSACKYRCLHLVIIRTDKEDGVTRMSCLDARSLPAHKLPLFFFHCYFFLDRNPRASTAFSSNPSTLGLRTNHRAAMRLCYAAEARGGDSRE